MVDIYIHNKQTAHIVAQIRAKQEPTKYSQDKAQESIVKYWEEHPDISEATLTKQFLKNLETYYNTSISINNYFAEQVKARSLKQVLEDVGAPIYYNKTHPQLNMDKKWVENQGEDFISQLKKGYFYHGLPNTISPDELPTLQLPSDQWYWGNENPSVTSAGLFSGAATWVKKLDSMPGAATFFPFLNSSYKLPDSLIPSSYPFASTEGMMLFGDYQYGAHRYFKEQLLFGPEDCSSAVGKATYLTTQQVQGINTADMQVAYEISKESGYKPDPKYHYRAITFLSGDIKDEQLKLIQPGDIYLVKGHTAIIATSPDNKSNITTLQFNRDIDAPENKRLGGGIYDYNLCDKAKEIKTGIYILRPSLEPLHESCSLSQLLHQIDTKYLAEFPEGPKDVLGDCRIFFENNVIGEMDTSISLCSVI